MEMAIAHNVLAFMSAFLLVLILWFKGWSKIVEWRNIESMTRYRIALLTGWAPGLPVAFLAAVAFMKYFGRSL